MNQDEMKGAVAELRRANDNVFRLLATVIESKGQDDEWLRIPKNAGGRCTVSGFSRSEVYRLIKAGTIRRKNIGGASFYSGADMRKHLDA